MAQPPVSAAASPDARDHVLSLCHMLANRIGRAFMADLDRAGVSIAEWRVLMTLAAHGTACGRDITERWAMDKMAVNRAIAALKGRGLVVSRKNPRDRRIVDLSLSADGRRFFDALVPVANARYRKLLAGLEKTEEAALDRVLRKLIAHADSMAD